MKRERKREPSVSPFRGISSMKRTCIGYSSVSFAMSEISSSLIPRIATAFILTGDRGVSSAAMIASQTFWK
jgi:hypothetical protein